MRAALKPHARKKLAPKYEELIRNRRDEVVRSIKSSNFCEISAPLVAYLENPYSLGSLISSLEIYCSGNSSRRRV